MDSLVVRKGSLNEVTSARTQQEKLNLIHAELLKRSVGIDRISIALYDDKTDRLKTFIASPATESPLRNYEYPLEQGSSLHQIGHNCQVRVVNDMNVFENHETVHSRAIAGHGFVSSYTYPMCRHGLLAGFVFFNSFHKNYFREKVLEQVEIFAHLVSEMIMNDLGSMHALVAALRTTVSMVHMRDPETGNHLERMARYTRLIARELVSQGVVEMDDEQIEQIYQFSPLHDVGKIGIPDDILQKPDKLDGPEREIMNSHTLIGRKIVDDLIENFGFSHLPYIDYLRHIAELHHETMDGNGYPHGLNGGEIALEARIIATSDVFDALTSQRPYKEPWSNDHAYAMLQLLSIDKLDKDCVNALLNRPDDVREIQEQFGDAVHEMGRC